MKIKRMMILFGILFSVGMIATSFAGDNDSADESDQMHHHMMKHVDDERISLGLSPKMKAHQLANMRSHVEAIQTIVGLIAEENFDTASEVAHSKLGLTEEMENMCNMFGNDDFKKLGLQFHKSADTLGEILKTKDMNKSLSALHTTMGYCVQCHETFRQ